MFRSVPPPRQQQLIIIILMIAALVFLLSLRSRCAEGVDVLFRSLELPHDGGGNLPLDSGARMQ